MQISEDDKEKIIDLKNKSDLVLNRSEKVTTSTWHWHRQLSSTSSLHSKFNRHDLIDALTLNENNVKKKLSTE